MVIVHIYFFYRRVMSHPVVCLLEEEKVERVRDILKIYPHDGFPVVDNYNPDLVSSSHK